jgi:hypothetical protein
VGGGQCGKKNLLHGALEAYVHKTTYGPLIEMLLKWENPLHGQVGGVCLGPGNLDFFGPQMSLA